MIIEKQQIAHRICNIWQNQQTAIRNMIMLARRVMPADWMAETEQNSA